MATSMETSIDDEVTVPSGSFVTALYRDEEWIYVERLDGQRGFIPDRSCSFYVEDGQAVPERQKISDRKKQQIFRELKKQQKWEKRTSTIRRAETFDFGQTTRQRYIKRGDCRPQNRSPFTTIDRKTIKAMKVGTLRVSANIDRFLESLPMTYDEDGEPFVKESSGEREIQYDFKARTEDELSVVRGQQLTILNTSDPNWTWVADSGENEGFVPASYFSLQPSKISDQSADVDTMLDFIVVEDFHAQHNVDMSVRKGERLKSANGSIHGWIWAGSVSDRVQGFVPACVTILASEL
ncbi:hypothetical protein L596_009031 [Steinernema carpocapsae]|uniref:SH3 domain-containing protein n=1 Tax=Steinernema carpocapsae TaxID=34508 RepID=A0A4U5PE70_STECR|nr:hypothetical protein L596_009031 [Steinernema carpocapsae]